MKALKNIIEALLNQIADFFVYFFVFYILSFAISLFWEPWKLFFNWRMFHISTAILMLLSIFSQKFRSSYFVEKIILKNKISIKSVFIKSIFNKVNYLKFGIISLILFFSILKGIPIVEFTILLFALISIFFVIDSRATATIALFLLTACPILIFFKKDLLAETFAVYAYYFLIIISITHIRLYLKNRNPST